MSRVKGLRGGAMLLLLSLLVQGCIPFMVLGAGNSAYSKAKAYELEKRIETLEELHKDGTTTR
tara:strand:+ start:9786 stop:9974 length:189 start_codon:yes stop_codon:yes gene_type:complete